MKKKIKHLDFYQEYWLTTFEGVVVALLVATIALLGIYWLLIIPVGIQLFIVWLLVAYKRLKKKTDVAIETNIKVLQLDSEKSKDELFDEAKKTFYNQNKIQTKIRLYHNFAWVLLIFSVLLVWYFPYIEADGGKSYVQDRNATLIRKMDSTYSRLLLLQNKIDSMRTFQKLHIIEENAKYLKKHSINKNKRK